MMLSAYYYIEKAGRQQFELYQNEKKREIILHWERPFSALKILSTFFSFISIFCSVLLFVVV
jgi:hypothetical protein